MGFILLSYFSPFLALRQDGGCYLRGPLQGSQQALLLLMDTEKLTKQRENVKLVQLCQSNTN